MDEINVTDLQSHVLLKEGAGSQSWTDTSWQKHTHDRISTDDRNHPLSPLMVSIVPADWLIMDRLHEVYLKIKKRKKTLCADAETQRRRPT